MSLDVYWPFPLLALSVNCFLTAFIWFFCAVVFILGICRNSFYILGFPCGSAGKESAYNAGNLGLGRSPGEGKGYPLQYSGLENSMDCIVHQVTKSQTHWATFTSLSISCMVYVPFYYICCKYYPQSSALLLTYTLIFPHFCLRNLVPLSFKFLEWKCSRNRRMGL